MLHRKCRLGRSNGQLFIFPTPPDSELPELTSSSIITLKYKREILFERKIFSTFRPRFRHMLHRKCRLGRSNGQLFIFPTPPDSELPELTSSSIITLKYMRGNFF